MSTRDEKRPAHKRPINKATMDEPQEEFIEPYAATVEPDMDYGSDLELAASLERWAERSERTA